MNRLISDILKAPEPAFSHQIQSWEALSGRTGHDVRLLSEIAAIRKDAFNVLNLDHNDTTPRELYYALRHKAADTNAQLEKIIGVREYDTPEVVLQKVIKFVDSMEISRDIWAVKHSVVKQLLKKLPPKKLLKVLGLRSIDSVLKRSNSNELLAMAYQIETPEWTQKMHNQLKKLTPTDFQASKSEIFQVDNARLEKLVKGGFKSAKIVVPNYETGSVLIVPSSKRFDHDCLGLTLVLLQSLYDLKVYSAYFRHISVKNNFGVKFHDAMHNGLPGGIRNVQIGWKALHKHFNKHPESFERFEQPHFQYDDIQAARPTQVLMAAIPDAEFWDNVLHVFQHNGIHPVSMNLMDVVVNASNQIPYEKSSIAHMQSGLWDELGMRYLHSSPVMAIVFDDDEL